MATQWPASIRTREVVNVSKVDRPDGYDWTAHLRIIYSNDVQSEWRLSGVLNQRADGLDWAAEFAVDNLPPNADESKLVRRIETKVTYGDPPAEVAQQELRPAIIEMTMMRADGHVNTTKRIHLLSTKTRELSMDEVVNAITGVGPNLPFGKSGFRAEGIPE